MTRETHSACDKLREIIIEFDRTAIPMLTVKHETSLRMLPESFEKSFNSISLDHALDFQELCMLNRLSLRITVVNGADGAGQKFELFQKKSDPKGGSGQTYLCNLFTIYP